MASSDSGTTTETGISGGVSTSGGGLSLTDADGRPALVSAYAYMGPSFLKAGDLDTPVLFDLAIGAGYPLYVGEIGLEPGAMITYSPVGWKGDMGEEGTAGLIGLLANIGGTYPIIPKLTGRADVGLGLLVMTGLKEVGNPFLEENQAADGAIGMFNFRFAAGAEYALTPNFFVNAQPLVLSVSPAGKLRDEVGTLVRYEFLVGAGYKM